MVGEGELGEAGSGAGHTGLETKVRHLDFRAMEGIKECGQGTQNVAAETGSLAASLPGQSSNPLVPLLASWGLQDLWPSSCVLGVNSKEMGLATRSEPRAIPHLFPQALPSGPVPLGSVTVDGAGKACSSPWPSDRQDSPRPGRGQS